MRGRRTVAVGAALVVAGVLAGCSSQLEVAAVVDGRTITEDDVTRVTEELGPYLLDSSPRGVLSALVGTEAGLDVAEHFDVAVTDEQADAFLDELAAGAGQEPPAEWGAASLRVARVQVASTLMAQAGFDGVAEEFSDAIAALDVDVNPRYGGYDPTTGAVVDDRPWIVREPAAG